MSNCLPANRKASNSTQNQPLRTSEIHSSAACYWSSPEEWAERFYKQIARFFPVDPEPSRVGLSLQIEQVAQSRMILALHARYEALVNILVERDN